MRLARLLFDWKTLFIYVHRWSGIAFSLVFLVWFVSGVAMMYVRMPQLSSAERLGHIAPLDLTTAAVSPAEAARRHDLRPDRLRLEMTYEGRPVYRFDRRDRVFADTGERVPGADRERALGLIRGWVPPQFASTVDYDAYLTDSDQWTLYSEQRSSVPLHRVTIGDPANTVYYVSEPTGEVTMKTDRRGRMWGFVSAVLHWTYFTALRQQTVLWQRLIAWGAIVGCVMCVLGIVIGIVRVRVRGKYRLRSGPSHSPYVGWMRWHHYTGLIFGVLSITWAFSGAMSLGRPISLRNAPPTTAQRTAVAGTSLDLEALTLARLRAGLSAFPKDLRPKEVDLHQFRERPYLIAYEPPPPYSYEREIGANEERYERRPAHQIVSLLEPARGPFRSFAREQMWQVAKAAMPGIASVDAAWLDEYDAYYYDKDGNKPLPVLRVRYEDERQTWLYLDPSLGTMTRVDRDGRWNRWLYHGLHSLDFGFLLYRRPLWDIVVILLSLGGVALSVTTLVPAWRRLARHARRLAGLMARYPPVRRGRRTPEPTSSPTTSAHADA